MSTLEVVQTYSIIQCTHEGCGVHFGLADDFIAARRADRRTFYCPNGHSRWYPGKTEARKQADRAEEAEKAAERLRRQLKVREENLQIERRSHAATKGQLTRTRRRVAHGVCPCCTRTFKQLDRHMRSQHPDFVEIVSP